MNTTLFKAAALAATLIVANKLYDETQLSAMREQCFSSPHREACNPYIAKADKMGVRL